MPISLPQVSLPTWSQTKTTSKQSFDKVYSIVDKLGAPINKLTNKIGSETFWPTTLDKESDKAARILRSFCKDGFYVEDEVANDSTSGEGPKGKARSVQKIPSEVIRRAKGLAIFTTMRTGLWVSGAGGSGILVARKDDGEWSPPSGILLHTAGLGFLVGVDIYDCVVVINTDNALEAFTKIRCTLGGEISAVAGPVGVGGVLETEIHKRQAPVWNYLKSRGFYAGVQIDGTVIIERGDENERFYGEKIAVKDILAGKVRHPPYEIRTLMATIKAAQGDTVVDSALPPSEPTPGDMAIEKSDIPLGFGLPAEDDPDPFGVKALEQEGMEIKEAGTKARPSMEAFEYKPSPSSPIFSTFRRYSVDSARRDSKRSSVRSLTSTDRGTQTQDTVTSPSRQTGAEPAAPKPLQLEAVSAGNYSEDTTAGANEQHIEDTEIDHEVPAHIVTKARLVSIPKRTPPTLPPRNPSRSSPSNADFFKSPTSAGRIDQGSSVQNSLPLKDSCKQFHDVKINNNDITPRHKSVENGLQNIHLSPSTQQNTPNNHPSPSASRDGFDEVSMSGSAHSKETGTFSNGTSITMQDNEAYEATSKHDHEITNDASEEFHSIPSTPVETTAPSLHGGKHEFS